MGVQRGGGEDGMEGALYVSGPKKEKLLPLNNKEG